MSEEGKWRIFDIYNQSTGNISPTLDKTENRLIYRSSEACSAGSGGLTTDLPAPVGDTPGCASPIPGGETCCEPGSPKSPSTTMYEAWQCHGTNFGPMGSLPQGNGHITGGVPLILSVEGRPAKTCPSPGNDADSTPETDPTSSSRWQGSSTLFDPDGSFGRTFRVRSLARAVGTSEQSLERWPTSGMAWAGGFSTAVSSECRSDADGCSSSEPALMEILEPPLSVPDRYSLSGRAARGILRRAAKRGRTLPTHLQAALVAAAKR